MKTCLVVGPEFHGYTRATAKAMARAGIETTAIETRPGHDGSLGGMTSYYAGRILRRTQISC